MRLSVRLVSPATLIISKHLVLATIQQIVHHIQYSLVVRVAGIW